MSTDQNAKAIDTVDESVAAGDTASKSKTELRAEATRARVELAQTLDAIEYKLNLPRQMRVRSRLFKVRLREFGDKFPIALAGIVLGGVSATVGAVWLGVKAVQRR